MDIKEEYVVYVLYSKLYDKTYTGYTSNLIERFKSHNILSSKGYTKRYRPWIVIFIKFFYSKRKAREYELYLKTGKGREFIKSNFI